MREWAVATFEQPTRQLRDLVTEPRFSHLWRPAPEPPADLYVLQRVLDGLRRLWIEEVYAATSESADSVLSV